MRTSSRLTVVLESAEPLYRKSIRWNGSVETMPKNCFSPVGPPRIVGALSPGKNTPKLMEPPTNSPPNPRVGEVKSRATPRVLSRNMLAKGEPLTVSLEGPVTTSSVPCGGTPIAESLKGPKLYVLANDTFASKLLKL